MDTKDLKITQRKVLLVLGKHKNEYLTKNQIIKESGVNINQLKQAIYKFMDNDWVFIDSSGYEEKVKISPEGMGAYLEIS